MPPKKKDDKAAKKKEAKAVRTAAKDAKKAKKAGKALFSADDDIDKLLAQFAISDKKKTTATTTVCGIPTIRVNASFTANPLKPELYLYGGEHYNGRRVETLSDLYSYNTTKGEWRKLEIPNSPPPRTSHQAVCVPAGAPGAAQLWVFGGDFTSPSQLFRHYNDLWVLDLAKQTWEQVKAPGGPPARSGHRMVHYKRRLFVFGGFFDSHDDIRYFDDLYSFDLDARAWTKHVPAAPRAAWPSPRSGFGFVVREDMGCAVLYGGFWSQLRKRGEMDEVARVETDMWLLNLSAVTGGGSDASAAASSSSSSSGSSASTSTALTWTQLKSTGQVPRSGMSLVSVRNRIYAFGGVHDSNLAGRDDLGDSVFYNDLRHYDIRKRAWETVPVQTGVDPSRKADLAAAAAAEAADRAAAAAADAERATQEEAARKAAADKASGWKWGGGGEGDAAAAARKQQKAAERKAEEEQEDQLEALLLAAAAAAEEDSLHSSSGRSAAAAGAGEDEGGADEDAGHAHHKAKTGSFIWPRRNGIVCVQGPYVYLFGGVFERGDVEVTLNDLHYWDSRKGRGGSWHTLSETDLTQQEWFGDDEEEDDDDGKDDDEDDEEDEDDEDGEGEEEEESMEPAEEEAFTPYFNRTKEHWLKEARKAAAGAAAGGAAAAAPAADDKVLRKAAFDLAQKAYNAAKGKS